MSGGRWAISHGHDHGRSFQPGAVIWLVISHPDAVSHERDTPRCRDGGVFLNSRSWLRAWRLGADINRRNVPRCMEYCNNNSLLCSMLWRMLGTFALTVEPFEPDILTSRPCCFRCQCHRLSWVPATAMAAAAAHLGVKLVQSFLNISTHGFAA